MSGRRERLSQVQVRGDLILSSRWDWKGQVTGERGRVAHATGAGARGDAAQGKVRRRCAGPAAGRRRVHKGKWEGGLYKGG